MAITIRNQKTEELIREIGRRTGEGPSAVVRRLVEREADGQDSAVPEDEVPTLRQVLKEAEEWYYAHIAGEADAGDIHGRGETAA